jgi:hypothetical protein
MRRVVPHPLWIGPANSARDLGRLADEGIEALIDLAAAASPLNVTREVVYCRFPLLDGAGNLPWLLRAALETTAMFIRLDVPPLVFCGAGLSRSPAVAAAALAFATSQQPDDCLRRIAETGAADVSPALWRASDDRAGAVSVRHWPCRCAIIVVPLVAARSLLVHCRNPCRAWDERSWKSTPRSRPGHLAMTGELKRDCCHGRTVAGHVCVPQRE